MCEHPEAMGNVACPVCTDEREAKRADEKARLIALEREARRQAKARPGSTIKHAKGKARTPSPTAHAKTKARAKRARASKRRNR